MDRPSQGRAARHCSQGSDTRMIMIGRRVPRVKTLTVDKNRIREQLKTKRDLLFEKYCRNPANTLLAIEIKLIDDQVAELTSSLVQEMKKDKCPT